MTKKLIETPFPSTADVAKKLGVSQERIREVERIVYRDQPPVTPLLARLSQNLTRERQFETVVRRLSGPLSLPGTET